VATLALCIGANTAVFSLADAVLLRPYPHVETDRWAYLYERPSVEGLQDSLLNASIPNFRDWRAQARSFSHMVLWLAWNYDVGAGSGEPERLGAAVITPNLFRALRVAPAAGRLLTDADGSRDVVIGYGVWQRRFGGDPGIVGKQIALNLVPHTVVGVAPKDFSFPPESTTAVWVAMPAKDVASATGRDARGHRVAALLAPGATFEKAQAELDVIAARLAAAHKEDKGFGVRVVPMREDVAGDFRAPLLTLAVALGLVALLACVNLASLQLTHLEGRRAELAVRAALGASGLRLLRHLLAENARVALAASLLGLALAPAGLRLLLQFVPPRQVPWLDATTSWSAWLVTAGVTLSLALLGGVLQAARAARTDFAEALASGRASLGRTRIRKGARHAFLVAQLALSLAPLVAAGLVVQSFVRLQRVDPGFDPARQLTLSYSAPRARYPTPDKIAGLAETLAAELLAVPGVQAAGMGQALPFARGAGWLQAVTRQDPRGVANAADLPHVRFNVISTGFVEALGVPLRSGRTFRRTDTRESEPVVVINESLARRYFPGEDPLGQRMWVGHAQALAESQPRTVIGVVGDTLIGRLDETAPAAAWVPLSQQRESELVWRTLFVVVKTRSQPLALAQAVRQRVAGVDKDLALTDLRAMDDRLHEAVWRQRLAASVLGALAAAALVIAVLGVVGIVGSLVSRRTHEIGVRMALGARPRDVVSMVLHEGGRLVAIGTGLGLLAAAALARSLSGLLYGVTALDPVTLLSTAAILAAAAMLACYVPARRAAGVAPLVALRRD
jgi:putative ABC transport system permease protein